MPAQALTKAETLSLSYEQVKGSGIANRCPSVSDGASNSIQISSGKKYKITELCLEPTSWQVIDFKEDILKQILVIIYVT